MLCKAVKPFLTDEVGLLDLLTETFAEEFEGHQELNNPYDEDDQPHLYGEFRVSWYSGYVVGFLSELAVGSAATKVAKGTKTYTKVADRIADTRTAAVYRTVKAPVDKAKGAVAAGAARASGKAVGSVVGGARSAGKSYRLWQLARQVDGPCGSGVSASTSCKEILEDLTPEQRQEVGRLVQRTDADGADLLTTLGPYHTGRLLSHHVDEFAKTAHGLHVQGSRHGIEVDLRYVDDGERYVRETGGMGDRDLSGLSRQERGDIAEQHVAPHLAKQKNYEIEYVGETHNTGFDMIARDPASGDYVIVESKFISDGGSVGKSHLGKSEKGRQMSGVWIDETIGELQQDNPQLGDQLETAYATGNIRKEMVVVQNSRRTGNSVSSSIEEYADSVNIVKIGKVVD